MEAAKRAAEEKSGEQADEADRKTRIVVLKSNARR
jgi:hypothetical protein